MPAGLFGEFSIADISIATFFRNAAYARYTVDAGRWPKLRLMSSACRGEAVRETEKFEDLSSRTPIDRRTVLKEAGAPISAKTYGTAQPPSVLQITNRERTQRCIVRASDGGTTTLGRLAAALSGVIWILIVLLEATDPPFTQIRPASNVWSCWQCNAPPRAGC